MRRIVFSIFLITFVCLLECSLVEAQTTTGRIVGTITDESGAVIPGVEIIVRNPGTGLTRTVVTEEGGTYNVPLLPPGNYEVEAQLRGFRKEVRRGITLQVDQVARLDFSLHVGEMTDEIQVLADAPLVQSESSSVGQVINSKNIVDLPLNQRTFMALTTLTVGVQPSVEGSNLSQQSLSFHSEGARERDNNFLFDGVDNNDPGNGQLVIIPSIDAIQEFKVQTSTYGAELGRAGGAAVNIQTKAGSNQFHGTVFEFLRNDIFDARSFFATRKPPYRRNQYGTVISGPIKKDHSFFMFNWEGTRVRQTQTALAQVPTFRQRAGDFSEQSRPLIDPTTGIAFPGNVIPANRIDPVGRNLMNVYPQPNRDNPQNNYLTNASYIQNTDIYTGRVDHRISDKQSIFGRFTWQEAFIDDPQFQGGTTLPGFGATFFQPIGRNVMLSDTYVFGPRVVNEFRVGFNRLLGGIFEQSYKLGDVAKQLGVRGVQSEFYTASGGRNYAYPRVDVSGVSRMRGTYAAQQRYDNTWHWFDMVAITRGRHQMKTGAEVRTQMLNIFIDSNPNGFFLFTGQYSGSGPADLLLGYPAQTQRSVGDSHDQNRSRALNFFFQDDWKVSSGLTLNLGMRWELQTPPVNAIGDLAFFDKKSGQITIGGKRGPQTYPHPINFRTTGETITVAGGLDAGIPRGGFKSDFNDFAPRFGFVWSPGGKGQTAIRGGYGFFYVPVIAAITHTHRDVAYPFTIPQAFIGDTARPNITLRDPWPDALARSSLTGRAIELELRNGYMQNWNLGIQRQLGTNMVIDVSYVGSKGNKLDFSRNINQAVLGPGVVTARRPFPAFASITQTEKAALSNYHSFQAKFERRFSAGWTFITAYTFSHSIDTDSGSSGTAGGGVQNPYDIRAERGNSVFDIRHRLVYSYSYELPFGPNKPFLSGISGAAAKLLSGWQVAGITTFASGQAFTPEVPIDISNTGGSFVRPNRVGSGALPRGQRGADRWFDKSAFVIPAAGTFGNSGRGILKGPGINNWDLTLMKNTPIFEKQTLQFRAEFFNLVNHPNFLLPERIVTSPAFGSILRAKDARQIQFGLKYNF